MRHAYPVPCNKARMYMTNTNRTTLRVAFKRPEKQFPI